MTSKPPSRPRPWAVCFVVLLALLAGGCRTNLMPEYAGRITGTYPEVRVSTVGTVTVQTGRQDKKKGLAESIANAAVGVAALSAAIGAEQKLRDAMPPERVRRVMVKEMAAWAPGVGFPFVGPAVPATTRLVVEVRQYGIQAAGDLSPASARFQLYGAVTFLPESKLIWEYSVWVDIPLSSVHVANARSSLVGDVSNVVAISNLSRRDVRRLFTRATRLATQRFMGQLAEDYQVGRAKYEAKHGPLPAAPPPPALPEDEEPDDDEPESEAPPAPSAPLPPAGPATPSSNPNEI